MGHWMQASTEVASTDALCGSHVPAGQGVATGAPTGQNVPESPHGIGVDVAPGHRYPAGHSPEHADDPCVECSGSLPTSPGAQGNGKSELSLFHGIERMLNTAASR